MRLSSGLLCSLAIVALATGCGSDSTTGDSTTDNSSTAAAATSQQPTTPADVRRTPLSRAAFLRHANEVCRDYNRVAKKLQLVLIRANQRAAKSQNFSPFVKPMSEVSAAADAAANQFLARTPPAKDVPKFLVVARALQAQAAVYALMVQAAEKDDGTQFTAAVQAMREKTPQLREVMRASGMKEICGAPK